MKKIRQLNVRMSDEEYAEVGAFCSERGLTLAEVVRRGVRSILAGTPKDTKAGAAPAPPLRVQVSDVKELGADSLRAPNRSLRR